MSRMRALLERHGLAPKKSWGQNFLVDERAVERIVEASGAGGDDTVVEIGAGLGALTQPLAERAGRLVAVDRDPDMIAVLRAELGARENVEIVAADAQTFDLRAVAARAGRAVIVVGNLPYQITSTLVFAILDQADAGRTVARAIVMVQREVADRLRAGPGSKTYGRLSVMVQQVADVRSLFHVSPGAFLPQPDVVSTVVSLVPRPTPRAAVHDASWFADVVRFAFAQRRKMLRRSLLAGFEEAGLDEAFAAAGVAGTRRAEELSVEEFGRLANACAARVRRRVGADLDEGSNDDA